MSKRFLIVAVLLLAACRSVREETSTPPVNLTTATPTSPMGWLETEMNGVTLGIWTPEGWETDLAQGLILAERTTASNGDPAEGMLIYIFVPPLDEFGIPDGASNFAWAVLAKVVQMPSHTGRDVSVSEPAGFQWGQSDAAYYLITTGDGVRALVLAVAIPGERKVVVCNISVAASQADRIRAALPELLGGLTVNGREMNGNALDALPDPLPFPRYNIVSGTDNRVSSGDPP
jgi:hypothetical protein